MKPIFFLYFLLWSLFACSPIREYQKKGDAFYQQMDYDLAATYYYNILILDSSNVVAKEALTKTGNLVLASKFSRFGNLITQNRNSEAIEQFLNNKRYYEKLKKVQVYLNWPSMYDGLFEDAKFDLITQTMEAVHSNILQNKYDKAELLLEQIAMYENVFASATVTRLRTCTDAFVKYAQQLNQQGKAYKSYQIIKKINSFLPSTPQSNSFLNSLVESLLKRMAILPIEEQVEANELAKMFASKLYKQMGSVQPDIIQLIPSNKVQSILTDSIRQTSAVETISKEMLKQGIQLYLQIAINDYKETSEMPLVPDSLIGFAAYSQQIEDKEKPLSIAVVRFKTVKYASIKKLNQITSRITYRLVDCASQMLIAENSFSLNFADSFNAYYYNGDLSNLYENLPAGNQMPERNTSFHEQFNLVNKSIKTLNVLRDELANEFVKNVIEDIQIYLKQD